MAVLTETELDKTDDSLAIHGYTIFPATPSAQGKIRVLLLLRTSLPLHAPPTLLLANHQEIWVRLPCSCPSGSWTVAAVYRQWGSDETRDMETLCDNARSFSASSPNMVMAGDFNLDASRRSDSSYYRGALLHKFLSAMEETGFLLANDVGTPTYRSHGAFGKEGVRHESVLDLVLTLGVQRPPVRVLPDSYTDHFPVLVLLPLNKSPSRLKVLHRRDFKRVSRSDLLMQVNAETLSTVFAEEDVDKIAGIVVRELQEVLDKLAPLKKIVVKDSSTPLYLQRSTRRLMQDRDRAAQTRDWPLFRRLRNQAARQVRKDRLNSNLDLLNRCQGDSKQVWHLANSLTGRSAFAGPPTCLRWEEQLVQGEVKLAEIMNGFFVEKVEKIRAGINRRRDSRQCLPAAASMSVAPPLPPPPPPPPRPPPRPRPLCCVPLPRRMCSGQSTGSGTLLLLARTAYLFRS